MRINETIKMIPQVHSILEIGCGSGVLVNKLSSNSVVGLDWSHVALQHVTRERVVGTCDHIPFKDSSFEMVIAAELLEHLNDETLRTTLEEIRRVTCKYIIISVPYKERPWETFVRCADCGNVYSPYGHKQYFDEDSIRVLIKSKRQKVKFCGVKRRLPFLKRIIQKVGIYSYRKDSICPSCGSKKLKYGKVEKTAYFMLEYLSRFTFPEPNWILCLYELRSENE